MKEIELLNLTEDDFRMLNEALENLPNKNTAGELMGELLISAFMKDGEEGKEKAGYGTRGQNEKGPEGKRTDR